MPTPISVDADITLRPFREGDAAELFAFIERDRTYLAEFLPWVDGIKTLEDEKKFVESVMSRPSTGSDASVTFIIEYRSEISGTIGIRLASPQTRTGEIGYLLAEAMQHRGIMTRACQAVTAHGFTEMEMRRIEIFADPDNPKSRAIPLRLGYTEDGITQYTMHGTGETQPMAAYSMTIERWRARPEA